LRRGIQEIPFPSGRGSILFGTNLLRRAQRDSLALDGGG
jgi:hypothetical protein